MLKLNLITSLFHFNRTRSPKRRSAGSTRRPIERLEDRSLLSAISWIGAGDGDWNVASNWSGGLVPGAGDDVTIAPSGAHTITISSGVQTAKSVTVPGDDILQITGGSLTLIEASTVSHVNVSGGNLTSNQQLLLTGSSTFSGGGSRLSGLFRNEGTFNITSGDPNLNAATFNNAGTIVQSGGNLDFEGDATLNNLDGAVYEVTYGGNISFLRNALGGNNLFHNTGTLRRNAATGDANIGGLPFQNDAIGVIEVTTGGTLTLNGNGSMGGGTFNVEAGAALNLSQSNFTLAGDYTGSGGGQLVFSNGTLIPSNATFSFPEGFFNWNSDASRIIGGTLNNTGFIQITSGDPNLNNAILNNSGTIINSGASLDFEGNATLNNLAGGLFDVTYGGNISFVRNSMGANNLFHNAGTLRKNAVTGDANIGGLPFQNDAAGVIEVSAGSSLTLNGSGTMASGTFNVATGAALNFSQSTFTLSGTYTGSGGGHIEFTNGTIVPNDVTFNFPVGFFNWSSNSARISGGTLNNTGFMQVTSGDPNLNNATLNNSGTITNSGANLDFEGNATLNNLAGGLFEVTYGGNLSFVRNELGANNLFHNTGTLRRNAASGDANIGGMTFQNDASGLIEVTTGSSLTLNGNGTMASGTFNVATGAVLNFSQSTFTLSGTYTGSGGGHLEFTNGRLTPDNATFNFPAGFFDWSGGAMIANGTVNNLGFIQIPSGDPNLEHATLNNFGTIVNSGARLDFEGESTLNNLAGAVFESTYAGNSAFLNNSTGANNLFHNTGVLRRKASGGDASISGIRFENDATGIIEVTTGSSLTLNGNGSMAGATFTVEPDARLNFNGSNFSLSGTYTGSGGGRVDFSNGTLTPSNATFNFPSGFFTWSNAAATIANGTVNNIGFIQITASDPNLNHATLNNSGTIINSGARLDFEGESTLNNLAGAVFDTTYVGNISFLNNSGANNLFHNSGVLRRSGTGDANFSGVPFQNDASAIIDVTAGSLTLNCGGSMASGAFNVAEGASLNFSGSNFVLSGTYSGVGSGQVNFNNGVLTPVNATFAFPAGYFRWTSAAATIANGTLYNTGFIQITASDPNLNHAVLNNLGTIVNSGARLDFEGESTLNNLAGAVFETTYVGNISFLNNAGANNLFHNSGVLRRSGAGDATFSGLPFQNDASGIVDITAGSLTLNCSGSMVGGVFNVVPGSALNFTGSNFTVSGNYSGGGGGQVAFNSGTITPANATFNFPAGCLNLTSAAATIANGTLNNAGFIQIVGGDPNLNNVTLNNTGTITNSGGTLDFEGNATLNNLSGALFDITYGGNISFVRNAGGPNNLFLNLGILRRSVGGDASFNGVPFSNLGIMEVDAGSFTLNTSVAQVVGSTLTGGAWDVHPGTSINLTGTSLLTNDGSLIFHGNGTINGISGALATNHGTIWLLEGADFGAAGEFTNDGELVIGADSVFSTTTTFKQGADGRVEFQLGGTPASGHFGQLMSASAANLAGTAAFRFVDGYGPLTGQQFILATFPSRVGEFAHYDQPLVAGQKTLDPLLQDTQLIVTAIKDAGDLAVSSVSGSSNAVSGQNVTVNWTTTNVSSNTTSTSAWTDSVYLSFDDRYDPSDILIGRVPHAGSLASGTFYNGTLTTPLPGALPAQYHFIVVADSQGQMPDADRANNTASSIGTVSTDVLSLTPGVPFTGTIADGQNLYFRVTLPPLATRDITLVTGTAGAAELLARQGNLPTSDTNDGFAFDPVHTTANMLLTGGVAGDLFLVLHGRSSANLGTTFTLTAQGLNFSVLSLDKAQARNAGDVTFTVKGSQFTDSTTFTLQGPGGSVVNASRVLIEDPGTAFVTFPLAGVAAGSYALTGQLGALASTLNDALMVTAGGTAGTLTFDLVSPRYIRPNGRPGVLEIEYQNTGDTDLPSQLLLLSATDSGGNHTLFSLPGTNFVQQDGIQLLAVNQDGSAGVLPPGARGTLTVNFEPTAFSGHAQTQFSLSQPSGDEPLLWDSLKSSIRPAFISNTAWDIVFGNFLNQVGTTAGSFAARLSADASYLSTVTHTTPSFNQLLNFELELADNFGAISARFRTGAFGTGFSDPNDFRARTDLKGNVSIGEQGAVRIFQREADGTFSASPGETGRLTLASGVYTLTETNGTKTVFRTDGKLDYIGTPDDDRLTYGYDSLGRIATMTASSTGLLTSFTYDGTGHVTAVDGPSGEHSTFSYDAAGRRTTQTTRNGTTTLSYVTAPGSAAFGAVASQTYPDGEVVNNTYDLAGRLRHTQNASGFLNLEYPAPGQVRITDTDGSISTYFLDDTGNVAGQLDATGQAVAVERNAAHQLTRFIAEDGADYSFQYDAASNITRMTMPDGTSVSATYTGPLNRIASFTNGIGATTRYQYDDFGRPTTTTFADGSTDTVTYNSHGLPLTETTRAGQTFVATYDVGGNLTSIDNPDTPDQTYTYDANGNLASVTDSTGTTHFTYDSGRRLTHVDYPGGSFIDYAYNSAGQRTQMIDSTGFTTHYIYGANGQISEIRDGASHLLAQYTYDASGRRSREDLANGTATTYAYDARDQIISVTHLAPGGGVQSFTQYTYDTAGRRATMVDASGTTTFGYDIDGRLSSVALSGGRTIEYAYDAHGNRTTVSDNGFVASYSVNGIDEYTAAGDKTFLYNLNGNITSITQGGVVTTFTYDSANRVTSEVSPTHVIAYQYNSLGQLIALTDNGVTRKFLYDPTGSGRMLAEFDGAGTLVRRYVQGVDGVVGQIASGGEFFSYGFDGSSNVTQLANGTGAVVNTYSYLPYGEILTQSETVANPYKYVGQHGVLDLGTGRNYAGVRLYDASLGRFLSPDSVRGVGENPYTYADNQPTNQVDFSGYDATQDTYSAFGNAGTNISAGSSATSLTLQAGQQLVDAAHSAKIDQMLSQGGGFLQETESMVLAGTSNQVAHTRLRFNKLGDRLGLFSTAVDANVFLNSMSNYAAGDHSFYSTLQLIHDSGALANDALGQVPHPLAQGASQVISILDWATQAPLTAFFEHYYSPNPNEVFGPQGQHLLQHPGHTEHSSTEQITPNDPNDIIGPNGPGADAIPDHSTPTTRFEGFVVDDLTYHYQINFENKASASAPAQIVVITDQLDSHLDWTTFELGNFAFGTIDVTVPAGHSSYHTVVDATATLGVIVDFNASINLTTGLVTWTLTSQDPTTGDVPIDPLVGFLPPNVTPPNGDAFVSYSVHAKGNLANGQTITAQATIVFDLEAPISTPLIHNTIDKMAPTSTVAALPATQTSNTFTVSWSGTDIINGIAGSGIATYDIYVSDNGAAFTPFLTGTTTTSASFTGQQGHTYGFYSVATDKLNQQQPTPAGAQATTSIPAMVVGGPAVTWVKKAPAVTVLPQVAVGGASFAGATLTIDVNAVGSKKKSLDLYKFPSTATLGSATGPTYANGRITLQIQLGANATASGIQAFLRGITFSTKGKGLNIATRTFHVTLSNAGSLNSNLSQTINVRKKA